MRAPNEAIQRERHTFPTLDDLKADPNGSKYFSKLDLTQGYHQIELDPASRNITTFSTHLGLRRYKRLKFGVTSAAETFQNIIYMFNAHMFFSKSKKINFSPEDAWRVAMRKLGQNPIVRKNFNFLENIKHGRPLSTYVRNK